MQENELRPFWKPYQENVFMNPIYLIYMYKDDLTYNIYV